MKKITTSRAIFLDMDGTLCVPNKMPEESTFRAIRKAQENGHKVFLCTGRAFSIISDYVFDMGLDGIIAGSGSHAVVGGETLIDEPFSEEELRFQRELYEKNGILLMLGTDREVYIHREEFMALNVFDDPGVNREMLNLGAMVYSGKMKDLSLFSGKVYNILFFTDTEIGYPKVEKALREREYDIVQHPPKSFGSVTNFEILRRNINKGTAVKKVCERLGIPLENSIAFGDSMNDYEMIRVAGLGVAMGNGDEDIKSHADWICAPVDGGGLADAFEKLGLI